MELFNIQIQSADLSNFWLTSNQFYNNTSGITFGEDVASGCQTGAKFNNNHVQDPIFQYRFTDGAEFTGNVMANRAGGTPIWSFSTISAQAACDTAPELFTSLDNNTWYQINSSSQDFLIQANKTGGTNISFANWKSQTGLDAASTQVTSLYPAISQAAQDTSATDYSYVWESTDEPDRLHVTIFGYKGNSSVPVDMTSYLSVGQPYEIIDAFCYDCAAVSSFTYAGGSVSFPMNLTSITEPIGNYTDDPLTYCPGADPMDPGVPIAQYTHPSDEFGVFIVRRQRTNSSHGYAVTNSTSSSTQVRLKLGLASDNLNWPTVTSAIANGNSGTITTDAHWPGSMYYQFEFLDASGAVLASSAVLTDTTVSSQTSGKVRVTGGTRAQ
jgi:hypothetical protein